MEHNELVSESMGEIESMLREKQEDGVYAKTEGGHVELGIGNSSKGLWLKKGSTAFGSSLRDPDCYSLGFSISPERENFDSLLDTMLPKHNVDLIRKMVNGMVTVVVELSFPSSDKSTPEHSLLPGRIAVQFKLFMEPGDPPEKGLSRIINSGWMTVSPEELPGIADFAKNTFCELHAEYEEKKKKGEQLSESALSERFNKTVPGEGFELDETSRITGKPTPEAISDDSLQKVEQILEILKIKKIHIRKFLEILAVLNK